jgi:hypothetical protein
MFRVGKVNTGSFSELLLAVRQILFSHPHGTALWLLKGTVKLTAALAVVRAAVPLTAGVIDPFAGYTSRVQMGPLFAVEKNWAGYVAELPQNPDGSVSAVSGSWIVPASSASANPAANVNGALSVCATWVGIDGFGNDTVEQVGTESTFRNGRSYYEAWSELYPAGPIGQMQVFPGDSITASVQYLSSSNSYQMTLADNTHHAQFTVSGSSSTALAATADWITEAPTSGTSIEPMPTFGSVTFTNAQATIGSTTGAIDNPAWQATQIDMSDSAWGDAMNALALTTTGAGSAASSSFTIIQVAPEPATPVLLAWGLALLSLARLSGWHGWHAFTRAPCTHGRG